MASQRKVAALTLLLLWNFIMPAQFITVRSGLFKKGHVDPTTWEESESILDVSSSVVCASICLSSDQDSYVYNEDNRMCQLGSADLEVPGIMEVMYKGRKKEVPLFMTVQWTDCLNCTT